MHAPQHDMLLNSLQGQLLLCKFLRYPLVFFLLLCMFLKKKIFFAQKELYQKINLQKIKNKS